MRDDPIQDGSGTVPAWLVAIRERMRGEVADLLDEEGRLRYDPDAPDAAETGARILRAFGRAAVDQIVDSLKERLAPESAAEPSPARVLFEGDFRKDLGEYLQGVLRELMAEARRAPVETGDGTGGRRGGDGTRSKGTARRGRRKRK